MRRVPQQQTLRETVSLEGVGLHSGNRVTMNFLPAPPNTGIRFRRVDLDGRPEVEARVENVSDTTRSTTLARGNIRIHTVEHVMAAFAGYGIDNLFVELNGNEPPIADGSARAYCRMIQTAGISPQPEKREPYRVTAPLELQVGDSLMSVFPHDRLKVTCTSADRHGRFTQFFSVEVSPETWERELAAARTFCFYEEIEFLIKNGLIRGGSLENAVVIRDDAVLTTEPLRYPEEFVRHKMLDILRPGIDWPPVAGARHRHQAQSHRQLRTRPPDCVPDAQAAGRRPHLFPASPTSGRAFHGGKIGNPRAPSAGWRP